MWFYFEKRVEREKQRGKNGEIAGARQVEREAMPEDGEPVETFHLVGEVAVKGQKEWFLTREQKDEKRICLEEGGESTHEGGTGEKGGGESRSVWRCQPAVAQNRKKAIDAAAPVD